MYTVETAERIHAATALNVAFYTEISSKRSRVHARKYMHAHKRESEKEIQLLRSRTYKSRSFWNVCHFNVSMVCRESHQDSISQRAIEERHRNDYMFVVFCATELAQNIETLSAIKLHQPNTYTR